MKKLNKKGFTLAELLIVVAVIAVLVAVAIPTFNNQLEKSRQGVDISNLRGAFAAARIAQMDQRVNNVPIAADKTYWYKPDTGELIDTATTAPTEDDAYGKALTATLVADDSGLNDKITYYSSDSDKNTLPTKGSVIQVTFANTDGTFTIAGIGFAEIDDGGDTPTITVPSGTTGEAPKDLGTLTNGDTDISSLTNASDGVTPPTDHTVSYSINSGADTLAAIHLALNANGTFEFSGTETAVAAGTAIFEVKVTDTTTTEGVTKAADVTFWVKITVS